MSALMLTSDGALLEAVLMHQLHTPRSTTFFLRSISLNDSPFSKLQPPTVNQRLTERSTGVDGLINSLMDTAGEQF